MSPTISALQGSTGTQNCEVDNILKAVRTSWASGIMTLVVILPAYSDGRLYAYQSVYSYQKLMTRLLIGNRAMFLFLCILGQL